MCLVTVIVPIYYGQKYVKGLIAQVEAASKQIQSQGSVELLLVNDAPNAPLNENNLQSNLIKIVVLNTDINRGIHGARVRGLSHAKGEYVIFLDQDDQIWEDYIYEQLNKIGKADAIVCRLISANKLQYTASHRFEDVITKDYMLDCWNSIESPGQVLIRKASIPNVWKQNIMKHNGADDYFLWLCMFAEGKKFALNQKILFEHIITDSNTSSDINLMMDSECEMVHLILKNHVFKGEDEKRVQRLPSVLRKNHVLELEIYRDAFYVYDNWLSQTLNGHSPIEIFNRLGIDCVAIYGAGNIGKSIYKIMKQTTVQVVFYIDRNAEYINLEIPVYTVENAPQEIGGIIISLFKEAETIKKILKGKFDCPIYTIREFLQL